MIQLFGKAQSRASRCLWALKELGVDYKHEPTDYVNGDTNADAYRAVNPQGTIPSLTDGNVKMFESLAINLYLAEKYGKGSLWPGNEPGVAAAYQWTLWAATELEPRAIDIMMLAFAKEKDEAKMKTAAEKAASKVETLEWRLSQSPYLAGDAFTIADLNVAAVAEYLKFGSFDFSATPKVALWLDQCLSRKTA